MDPFIGQIMMFGGNFAPRGWAECNGQLLAISANQALFSILGTTYGGDGRTTFGLPDLRGRVAVNNGTGPGLSPFNLGQKGGSETNTLVAANLPPAPVTIPAAETADSDSPSGKANASTSEDVYGDPSVGEAMSNGTIQGNSQPVNNLQPYLAVTICIALVGVFPSRN